MRAGLSAGDLGRPGASDGGGCRSTLSYALSWSGCPQRPQPSVGVSLRSCRRRSGPLSCAGIRINLRGDGDSGGRICPAGSHTVPRRAGFEEGFLSGAQPSEGVWVCQLLASGIPLWGEPSLKRAVPKERVRVAWGGCVAYVLSPLREAFGSVRPLCTSP